jgi:hypothetical protein
MQLLIIYWTAASHSHQMHAAFGGKEDGNWVKKQEDKASVTDHGVTIIFSRFAVSMQTTSRPASASTRTAHSPLPRVHQVNTQTKVLDTVHGRILCIADIRGRHSALNDLARDANAKAIIHTGDFGFFGTRPMTCMAKNVADENATQKSPAALAALMTAPSAISQCTRLSSPTHSAPIFSRQTTPQQQSDQRSTLIFFQNSPSFSPVRSNFKYLFTLSGALAKM